MTPSFSRSRLCKCDRYLPALLESRKPSEVDQITAMHANDDGIGELFGRARGYASHDFESEAVCAIDGRDAYEPPFSTPRSTHDRDS